MSADRVCIHDRVEITKKRVGVVAFIGFTYFALEPMYGIILDTADGKNNGKVKGRQYFVCKKKHGIFVPRSKIIRIIRRKLVKFHDRIAICDNVMTQSYGSGNVKFVGAFDGGAGKYDGIWYGISLDAPISDEQIQSMHQKQDKHSRHQHGLHRHQQQHVPKKRMSAITASHTNYIATALKQRSLNNLHEKQHSDNAVHHTVNLELLQNCHHDGKFNDVAYFYCRQYHGLFVRQEQLSLIDEEKAAVHIAPKLPSSSKVKN